MQGNYLLCWSKTLPFSDRCDGDFGSRAPYWCCNCERAIWKEPDYDCTYYAERSSRCYREEPDEYEWICPHCGAYDVVEQDQDLVYQCKLIRRYRLNIKEMK